MTAPVQQGHRYRWFDNDVLALESGMTVPVALIEPGRSWLGEYYVANASELTPLPMRYFHGEVPRS